MFCRNCGKELIGTPEICPNCGARPLTGTSFCPSCGSPTTPMSEICVKCGTRLISRYPITIDVRYSERLSRLTTFFRIFMIIPQWIVLYFLGIAASVVLFISWWAILILGRYPRWAFDFVSGYFRWYSRVGGYSLLLTDKYPPFSFK